MVGYYLTVCVIYSFANSPCLCESSFGSLVIFHLLKPVGQLVNLNCPKLWISVISDLSWSTDVLFGVFCCPAVVLYRPHWNNENTDTVKSWHIGLCTLLHGEGHSTGLQVFSAKIKMVSQCCCCPSDNLDCSILDWSTWPPRDITWTNLMCG